ncbi:aminotransferase class I/II-fold pyridoxal phosphate-dependent enzyme [Robertmurraya kyonggiensis]|uniref:Aminotransferase class I/II-fold pyridoxal phosphate-dependent enzyme n=1 Tax=Robertmurraya kyonggiensis TaxID=1037680 RepID=A0A4U1CXE4_9BACI|nr:aminotransferase class I/II-fold pyridoxal phosphate-dependent enzyme [Robertmurraya kyonggiensis]TKC13878.1 aminotransferase class I/II-fold pyridoxal phosphate-dependent enzyme [Robertmurraya kyonggiensis]
MNQFDTPLFEALKKHNEEKSISLHVPGHKNGLLLQSTPFFQDILNIDVTELTNLDDLHSPEGAILEAEELLADAYKVERSFFLVNGSTVGNLAMMMATLKKGDIAFIQRNCHKSVLNGIELTEAQPVLLGPEQHEDWGVAGGVSLDTIKNAYALYPDCKAIILTYPNYYGMTFNLKEIIQFAHDKHIPVLIDEAHGAHFIGGEYFPPSAVELGADVVVQSAHKTLPAMTMGSFLHVNSEYVSVERVNHYLRILQSSSPSYPLMASLDVARSYIGTYTKEDEAFLKESVEVFKKELGTLDYVKVLEYPNHQGDPLKLTLQSRCVKTGFELQRVFEEKGIYTEMADPINVLLVLPLLKKNMSFPFDEIMKQLREINLPKQETKGTSDYFHKEKISILHKLHSNREVSVPIEDTENDICAETIIPYPPGIPLLLKGEMITKEDVKGLIHLVNSGARFQGGALLTEGKLNVFTQKEI